MPRALRILAAVAVAFSASIALGVAAGAFSAFAAMRSGPVPLASDRHRIVASAIAEGTYDGALLCVVTVPLAAWLAWRGRRPR